MVLISSKGTVLYCCFTATALVNPSDCKSTYFPLEVELIVRALSCFRASSCLQPTQLKQKRVQLRSTVERCFALGAAAMLNIALRAPSPG